MQYVEEGELCHRCKTTPILDKRLPFCSECRKILEKETAEGVKDRNSTEGKKIGPHFTYFKNGKKRFTLKIPAMAAKHKKK